MSLYCLGNSIKLNKNIKPPYINELTKEAANEQPEIEVVFQYGNCRCSSSMERCLTSFSELGFPHMIVNVLI